MARSRSRNLTTKAVIAVMVLASTVACRDEIHEQQGYDPGAGRYDYRYVIDEVHRFETGSQTIISALFSSEETVLTLPTMSTASSPAYLPALTVYINSGGQFGSTTVERNQCTGAYSCFVGHLTMFDSTRSGTAWCSHNGSMFSFIPWNSPGPGLVGRRYWICNGTRWSGSA